MWGRRRGVALVIREAHLGDSHRKLLHHLDNGCKVTLINQGCLGYWLRGSHNMRGQGILVLVLFSQPETKGLNEQACRMDPL